jgi:hypothetical protein
VVKASSSRRVSSGESLGARPGLTARWRWERVAGRGGGAGETAASLGDLIDAGAEVLLGRAAHRGLDDAFVRVQVRRGIFVEGAAVTLDVIGDRARMRC